MKKQALSAAVAAAILLAAPHSHAQSGSKLDIGRLAIAGYGDVTFMDQDGQNSTLNSRFIPIFLFQLSERIHIESEVEFSVNEQGETEAELEYADMHYFVNDNTIVTAGKFLLPFGQFGPNLHPSWINKLPTTPAMYGHGGNGLMKPMIPVLSDMGVNISNVFKLGTGKLFTDFYLVSGPGAEAEESGEAGHDEGLEEAVEEAMPEVAFEATSGDNNNNKAFGGRIAYAFLPQWEVGYSFYRSKYDAAGELAFNAHAVDVNWLGTFSTIRGEYISTTTEGRNDEGGIDEFKRSGWYLQGNWQARQLGIDTLNPVELVLRYSKISKIDGGKRWTAGVNYWLEASAVLKVAYEDTKLDDGSSDNRIFAQLAFGF